MELTGAHWQAMAALGGELPGLEGVEPEELILARLVLLDEGADPADPAQLVDLLSGELPTYVTRLRPVQAQLDDAPDIVPLDEGGYRVGDHTVSQLLGYHRRMLLSSMGDLRAERRILMAMTGLSATACDELPIGTYQALMRACGFLAATTIRAIWS